MFAQIATTVLVALALSVHWTTENEHVQSAGQDTLVLTHVIFRHGNRTPDREHELYPNDPYLHEAYHPYGNGQLTKVGKRKEYEVGKALRERYDALLGDRYYPEAIEAYSTDYDRTKVSLQLALAGLFPPRPEDQFVDQLSDWQPIPFNYLPKNGDKVLLGVLCPTYLDMYDAISRSEGMSAEFAEYSDEFAYLSRHTGLDATRFLDAYNLYFGLSTEEEWGFRLPDWTAPVWPDTITKLAIKEYFVSMRTHPMRQMATGYFLEKVIEDTKRKILNGSGRKIHLYSAHENNVAELLMSLGVFDRPHVPTYGAWLALEVHFVDNVYGLKVFYENYDSEDGPRALTIPECGDVFCPLDKFIAATDHLIPDQALCGL